MLRATARPDEGSAERTPPELVVTARTAMETLEEQEAWRRAVSEGRDASPDAVLPSSLQCSAAHDGARGRGGRAGVHRAG